MGRLVGLILMTLFFSFEAYANLNACLELAYKNEHRLDRLEATQTCFEKNRKSLSIDSCFKEVDELKLVPKSVDMNEQLKAICFYNINAFKTVQSCLKMAQKFEIAANHDEAVFDCYRQFQNKLNKSQCLQVAEHLTYPAKKKYLKTHCENNVD